MFENIMKFFKKANKREALNASSKETAKERLHLVLMQDRANVSADFLDLMKQEIIDVIKKYVEVDEKEIDVRLTNQSNEDGTNGAPALYANIPIVNIKNDVKAEKMNKKNEEEEKEKEPEEKAEVKTPAKRGRKKKTEEKNTETETKVPEKKEEKKAEKVEKVEEAEENPEDLEEDVTKKEESESLEEKVKEKPEE